MVTEGYKNILFVGSGLRDFKVSSELLITSSEREDFGNISYVDRDFKDSVELLLLFSETKSFNCFLVKELDSETETSVIFIFNEFDSNWGVNFTDYNKF